MASYTSTKGGHMPQNNTTTQARRESATKFTGLMDQKRNSLDAEAKARRQSFHEQKPATGFVGNMWNSIMRGHDTK